MKIIKAITLLVFLFHNSFAQNLQQVTDNGSITSNGISVLSVTANSPSFAGVILPTNISQLNGYRLNGLISDASYNGITYQSGGGGGAAMSFSRGGSYDTAIDFFTNYAHSPGNLEHRMRIASNGNVGIGTTNPTYMLDVNGTSNMANKSWFGYNSNISGYSWTDAALTTNSIEIVNNNGTVSNSSPTLAFHRYGTGGPQFRLAADGSNVLYLESSGANSSRSALPYGGGPNSYFQRLHIDGALSTIGDVGIGTTDTRGFKLAVNGKIRAHEIKVETANWPDYVFSKSYQLPTLQETEKHIKEKGHLPGIPSAEEVKANGIDLGEMNAKLLQKIEELTLHLIEIKKQSDQQNAQQAKEIEYLKSKIK